MTHLPDNRHSSRSRALPFSRVVWPVAGLLLGALLLALVSCSGGGDANASNQNHANQSSGGELTLDPSAPTFAAFDTRNQVRQSTEWIGRQPVVINFWGTWCPPCRKEIPYLVQLYDEFNDYGIEIVSIALNDQVGRVNDYVAANNMSWIQLMGDEDVTGAFGEIRAVPTTIFLDATGKEIERFRGLRDYNTLKSAFEKLAAST